MIIRFLYNLFGPVEFAVHVFKVLIQYCGILQQLCPDVYVSNFGIEIIIETR